MGFEFLQQKKTRKKFMKMTSGKKGNIFFFGATNPKQK
jgi:hypothetical protein